MEDSPTTREGVHETGRPNSIEANSAHPNGPKEGTKISRPKRKPNYALIHSKPLPLSVHPLPAFHPTNPISLFQLVYVFLSQLIAPPSSHPPRLYVGYFSAETCSVHVTDPQHARALWEMGFFGKGTLSRSEPSWMERERAKLREEKAGGRTAEEATNARRAERRLFKLERARLEREKIEQQRLAENGSIKAGDHGLAKSKTDAATDTDPPSLEDVVEADKISDSEMGPIEQPTPTQNRDSKTSLMEGSSLQTDITNQDSLAKIENEESEPQFENQEHLQLTLEEAFFLSFGLGVLDVKKSPREKLQSLTQNYSNIDLFSLFTRHSFFSPRMPSQTFLPDDPFILNYVTYHHFRSIGWIVRPGVKFSVDYLLYNRGPVFSHAEFGVIIIPSYSDPFWNTEVGIRQRRIKAAKDWWWLHCVNRVQSQVRKSLVVAYIDVPAPVEIADCDIKRILRSYNIREFVVKRWLANRSRD